MDLVSILNKHYIYIYIYIYMPSEYKVVHHGSPILHHGYVQLGKYHILARQVYMNLGIINNDKRLTSLIFHYIQGLPRSKCPRQDSNPGKECNNQISQPPELRLVDYIYIRHYSKYMFNPTIFIFESGLLNLIANTEHTSLP